ncbi:hypothetical protein [Streptomyces sp. x-19]|uniref:hypothetical protein n=1 Tax=Streptomyces sp. x-19 TaxID=2789280 RepID=UPI00397EF232
MGADLPDGWTIGRVRSVSGDAEAVLLSLERLVVVEQYGAADYDVLQPDVILSFHDLCLARADDDWFMGQLDGGNAKLPVGGSIASPQADTGSPR